MNKHTQLLGGLLARIFRDGGHAQGAIGDGNAAKLADELIVHYRSALDAIEQTNRILERVGIRVSVCHKSDHLHRVTECMRKGGQTVRLSPEMPTDPKERIRIVKLVIEEGLELAKAMGVRVMAHDASAKLMVCLTEGDGKPEYSDAGQESTDLIEAADALADLSVVTGGGFGALGIADLSLLELIDKNNLSKFDPPTCPDCGAVMEKTQVTLRVRGDEPAGEMLSMKEGDEVGKVMLWVCSKEGDQHQVREEREGPWIREDGKYMKPPYWQPPDVKGLLEAQKSEAKSWAREYLGSFDFSTDAPTVKGPDKLKWETESTPVKINGVLPAAESVMSDAERDEYAGQLKIRFWRNLPWRERTIALRNTLGLDAFPIEGDSQPIPQTIEVQLIKRIRDQRLLTTFEHELDMAEKRHATTGDFDKLQERFWLLTPQARMVFWRTQIGTPVPPIEGEYPRGVQDKMLEAYKYQEDRVTLRSYLDRVAPVGVPKRRQGEDCPMKADGTPENIPPTKKDDDGKQQQIPVTG